MDYTDEGCHSLCIEGIVIALVVWGIIFVVAIILIIVGVCFCVKKCRKSN